MSPSGVTSPVASTVKFVAGPMVGPVVSTTVTSWVEVDKLPPVSIPVQLTSVVPNGKPASGAFSITSGVPVATPISSKLSNAIASSLTSAGGVTVANCPAPDAQLRNKSWGIPSSLKSGWAFVVVPICPPFQ